eukprot:g40371.t1
MGSDPLTSLLQLTGSTDRLVKMVKEQWVTVIKGGTQGKLAGGYLLPTAAASENQLIQDISRTISKKITASELSAADVGPMTRSVIRRYPAFVKSAVVSAKVLLSIPPARVRVSLAKGQKAEGPKIQQAPSGEGPGRPRSPGIEVPGSPAISQTTKLKKGTAASPSLQQIHKGAGMSEPNKQEIPGGSKEPPQTPAPNGTSSHADLPRDIAEGLF